MEPHEKIEQALQGMADGFAGLAAAVRAQTEELRAELYPKPKKSKKSIPNNVIRFPEKASVRPRVRRYTPLTRWPEWGTEHVMTCTNKGCITCRRLATVKHGA